MSIDQTVYVGCYLRVYMPMETVNNHIGKCPKCGQSSSRKFCDRDGAELVFGTIERMSSFSTWAEENLGDEDMFYTANVEWKTHPGYEIVLANKSTQSGHVSVGDELETEIPPVEFFGDWITLMGHLELSGIRYEKKFGVVSYWS